MGNQTVAGPQFDSRKKYYGHCGPATVWFPSVNANSIYTEQNYKRNTFVFAPIFHELNSKV